MVLSARLAKFYFTYQMFWQGFCFFIHNLFQVHLQTQQRSQVGIFEMTMQVIRNDGVRGLYNGISASLLRQVRYIALIVKYNGKCVTDCHQNYMIFQSFRSHH